MPSSDQIKELYNNNYTTTTWTTENGVKGCKITSINNGNSLFLPAAGSYSVNGFSSSGSYGLYWSRSLYIYKNDNLSDDAYGLNIYSSDIYSVHHPRFNGRTVRPVRKK